MSEVTIRRNHRPSLPDFARLNAAWIQRYHHMEDSDKAMVARPETYIDNGGHVFTAHLDDVCVGAVALKPHPDGPNQGEWELTKMAVDPAYGGRGIGMALLNAAEEYARDDLGLSRLFLLSNTVLDRAKRLYERNGWVQNHAGPHPVYERANYGMEKQL
jgi:GNAT superfamily N-acetyltransferase